MKITVYPITSSQLAKVNCRMEDTIFDSSGSGNNITPTITVTHIEDTGCSQRTMTIKK